MIRSASFRLLLLILVLLPATMLVAACGSDDDNSSSDDTSEVESAADATEEADADEVAARADSYDAPPTEKLDPKQTYTVRMETTKGDFDIVVDQKAGPIAAANFVFLVKEGYYDGIKFHRVIDGFMVQAGDPLGNGTGGPGYNLKDDPVKGKYEIGTVAMANAGPNTGGSQFFIVQGTQGTALPPDYVIFGKVDAEGMKVVDEIAAVEVEPGDSGEPSSPVEDVVIERATLV